MKKIFLLIITVLLLFIQTLVANAEPAKIMSLSYDDSASLIVINSLNPINNTNNDVIKFSKLENPNRIYFDLNDSILIGDKQQLIFEKTDIKEIKLSQFTTNPDVVRCVITFAEDFDSSKVKVFSFNGNIFIKNSSPKIKNDYFNTIYDEEPSNLPYSSITINSQVVQKIPVLPQNNNNVKVSNTVMADIEKAFQNSTLNNSDGKTYDSLVSIDLSSNLKLRTKYFINGYYQKNSGLLVSGVGQLTATKIFYLSSPQRVVLDLPNTFVDKKIRNKEIKLCPDNSCKDTSE